MSTNHRRKPYMPDSDQGKKLWMQRFITQIESDPQRYGFDDPRMFEYYQRTIRTFIKAVDRVASPATRTPGAVAEKNKARKDAVKMCRDFAIQFKWDSTLSEDEKRALGINTREAPPEQAKVPEGVMTGTQGYPSLVVLSSPNGGHVIRYRDTMSTAKAKPKGVSHMLLFGAIGEKPNMRKTHARLLGAYTKRPFEIKYPVECGLEGLYVTYFGRWLTTRGEMSPWSPGVSKIIGETQVSLRESEFGHLFGKQGFVDALPQLPQGTKRGEMWIDETRPLLESGANEGAQGNGLFAALGQLEAATVRMLNAA
jgi:hypothetical protein